MKTPASIICKIWCGLIGDLLIGPLVLEECLNAVNCAPFLMNELSLLLEDMALEMKLGVCFQHDGAPRHSGCQVTAYLEQHYRN
jgi:hypothetical protein